jgi:hypothetical protein
MDRLLVAQGLAGAVVEQGLALRGRVPPRPGVVAAQADQPGVVPQPEQDRLAVVVPLDQDGGLVVPAPHGVALRRERGRLEAPGQGRGLLPGIRVQELDPEQVLAPAIREDLLALDEALTRLAAVNPQAAQLVQLRYFAGLSIPEAAQPLGLSPRSADRLWAYARAWLHQEITGAAPDDAAR